MLIWQRSHIQIIASQAYIPTFFSFFTFSSWKAYLTFCSRFPRDPSVSTNYTFEKTNCTATINQVDFFQSLVHAFSSLLPCYSRVKKSRDLKKCFKRCCLQIILQESVWLELMLTQVFFHCYYFFIFLLQNFTAHFFIKDADLGFLPSVLCF